MFLLKCYISKCIRLILLISKLQQKQTDFSTNIVFAIYNEVDFTVMQ